MHAQTVGGEPPQGGLDSESNNTKVVTTTKELYCSSHDESSDIGARLIEARIAQGLSQRELANRLGLHQQQVARWERGYLRVSLSRLSAVAGLLGMYLTAEAAAPLRR